MPVFLPVAGLSINALLLIGSGACVGFLSGLLGVGGGFLLTPILMLIGIPPTVAAASDTNAIVATSSSGVAAHFRLGNVDIKMGSVLLLGGLTGAAIGVEVIKILRVLGNADVLIKLTYIVVLGAVGGFMMIESLRNLRGKKPAPKAAGPVRTIPVLQRLPFQMEFPRSRVKHSVFVPFFLCALVGILAAIMGVGGGFLMVPMMVYLLRMPAHVAVGTDLFQILFTCAGVTLMQAMTNQTVDVVLALLLAAGSTIGAQIGAAVSRYLRGEQLLILLATLALGVVVKMGFGLVMAPSNLLELGHGEGHAAEAVPGKAQRVREAPERALAGRNEAAGRPVTVVPRKININGTYSGTDMRIEGVASPGSQVVVVARGPDTEETFKRKGRAGPIWVTAGRVEVSGVPSLFIRYAPEPAERFLRREEIERFQLDPQAIQRQMHIEPAGADAVRLREDYVRLKVEQRVYRVIDGAVRMGAPGPAGVPYLVQFHWPRKAPPDTYEVRVHECRDGSVTSTTTVPLEVVKTGFPALIAALSTSHALYYGIAAVVIAILAGFFIDFLASRLRRRLTRRVRPSALGGGATAEQAAGKSRFH